MTKIDARVRGVLAAAMLCMLAPVAAVAAEDGMSESDRFFLTEAEGACRSGDFDAFLWPFANSAVVRERYTSLHVAAGAPGRTREVPKDRYLAADDFPIVMIDYAYVTGASARAFDAPGGGDPGLLVYVQVDSRTSPDGIEQADWLPGRFEPGEGDELGPLIEQTGPGGTLQFQRTADCWQLTGDIRNPAGAR